MGKTHEKSASQRTLRNASKLTANQINLQVYSMPKPSLWQRIWRGILKNDKV
ncbi:hypothetical protein [Lentilactobacillus hilgardii]|uniref:Uncharacterized protein n=1 Tax=Lentilactobacillus hilgardii (strain ATCC 8290 / DSM 20176 / CCUG 30140 / JCM 1155 / KCTC 3500 / NBRC 15886 / NCIMB 8040 / NRRL B-1843 / 9) TaxID=1423757 RepID=C0XG19_LENH9|nr:hypothetical protein [Lentilactobacillus hilgardii]EEI25677.1 hypothetical protein HMPREF0519_0180 [Lentilactobacillus hilgardii DSM 20176 = ATCC 8290]KRK50239.1 hypothetical protein FD42_GL002625 [Lentilactobacillus hilgardii DSM 20176 = ATCC 8290]TDG86712.1 hypothetical protein C5L34_000384 [Lentilactobacillus hilgardii]